MSLRLDFRVIRRIPGDKFDLLMGLSKIIAEHVSFSELSSYMKREVLEAIPPDEIGGDRLSSMIDWRKLKGRPEIHISSDSYAVCVLGTTVNVVEGLTEKEIKSLVDYIER